MRGVIYKHTLTTDCNHKGGSYIGQTYQENPTVRGGYKGHQYKNTVFGKAIKKYGGDNFSHEIIEDNIPTRELANEREKYWIAFFHTWTQDPHCKGYNTTLGGEGAAIGHHTEEYNSSLSKKLGGKDIICIETQEIFHGMCATKRLTGIKHVIEVCQHKREIAGGYHGAFVDDIEGQEKFKEFIGCKQNITKLSKRKVYCVELALIFESTAAAYRYLLAQNIHASRIHTSANDPDKKKLSGGYHGEWINDTN